MRLKGKRVNNQILDEFKFREKRRNICTRSNFRQTISEEFLLLCFSLKIAEVLRMQWDKIRRFGVFYLNK